MDTFEAIRTRRSVKHYDPTHQMTEDEIRELLSLAILSPTSFNIQNWRFVVVRDPSVRAEVKAAAWGQSQVTDASLLLVLCANLDAWRNPARYWQEAPPAVQAQLVPMIEQLYGPAEQLQRDEALRSVGIVSQTIMLAARAMGYDSCPMVGFDPVKVANIIQLPPQHLIGMLITIGKPIKPANPRGGQLPLEEVMVIDRFPAAM